MPGYEGWLADPGVVHRDVLLPAMRGFDIRTCIPPGTVPGLHAFDVFLSCDGEAVASQRIEILVGEETCTPPAQSSAQARDLSDCSKGVRVSWDPVAWPDPARPGVLHVRRGLAECADAARQPPVVASLPGNATSWVDGDAPAGTPLTYVVEAEAPGSGAACIKPSWGGAATRACTSPAVVDAGEERFPRPSAPCSSPAIATRRLPWNGPARALLPGEHFHLLKASDDPRAPFVRLTPEGDRSRAFTETDVASRLQFFDLRVANACEDQSADEFPPGWDVER